MQELEKSKITIHNVLNNNTISALLNQITNARRASKSPMRKRAVRANTPKRKPNDKRGRSKSGPANRKGEKKQSRNQKDHAKQGSAK